MASSNAPSRRVRRALVPALLGISTLCTACGGVNELVDVQVTPSGAAIYVDGKSQGEGSQPVRFAFDQNRRVILQVVYEGHQPFYSHYDAEQIARLADSGRGITVTLRSY